MASTNSRATSGKHVRSRPYGGYQKPFDPDKLKRQIDFGAPLMRWSRALVVLDALQDIIDATRSNPATIMALMKSGLVADVAKLLTDQLREPSGTRRPLSLFRLVPVLDDLDRAARKTIAKHPPKGRSRRFLHRRELARVREMMIQ